MCGAMSEHSADSHAEHLCRLSARRWMQEFVDLLFRFFTLEAITFLQLTDHFFKMAFNLEHVIVSQLPPSPANIAFYLVPSAFQNVRIHAISPFHYQD